MRRRHLWSHWTPVVLLLCSGAAAAAPPEAHHVLIVAHNRSLDPGVQSLRFADDDGARYFELFSEVTPRVSLLSVLDPDTARTHPGAAKASRVPWMRTLRQEVARTAREVAQQNRAGQRTVFTFIYVGHGNVGADGQGYVNLQDVRLRRRDLFKEVIDRVPAATIHLIIDACKSYFLVARGPKDWRDDRSGHTYGQEVKAFLSQASLATHPQVGAILSTSGDEEVHEWSGFRSGVFSHQLRSALSGGADINGDGRVEYSEVGAFIAAANRHVVHQRARLRPFLRAPPSNRHASLFNTRRGSRGLGLALGRRLQGRFSVEDDRGVRVADINKGRGLPLLVALSPDRRYFVRHLRQEAVIPADSHGLQHYAALERGPGRPSSPRGSVDQAYRDDMFSVPLTRGFYDGFVASSELPAVSFRGRASGPEPEVGGPQWTLSTAYALSPAVLDSLGGLQHGLTVGLRRSVWGPLFLSATAELGLSRKTPAGEPSINVYRGAVLLGAGLAWRIPQARLELTVELSGGYQALLTSASGERDPSSAKLGSRLAAVLRPLPRSPHLGLFVAGGLFGHVVTVASGGADASEGSTREHIYAVPEGNVGLSWDF